MTVYYCINQLLDRLETANKNEPDYDTLVPVTVAAPECAGHPEDAFSLSSSPRLLDLREMGSLQELAWLLEKVPLYNINMELALDEALTERHRNPYIETALGQAFAQQPLPSTLKSAGQREDVSGGLRHPMLGHLDKLELCQLYINFINVIDRGHDRYNFEKNILGKQKQRFTEYFDGYVTARGGEVKAEILIAFAHRVDHEPGKPMETYTDSGKKQALRMNIGEMREFAWAWLEAEQYQMRRSRDLDRLLRLPGLRKVPNWVRTDVFALLGREAMKQVFAEQMVAQDSSFGFLEGAPGIKRAISLNAQGQVDEALQQLLTQVLSAGSSYAGAAARFAENADKRSAEAKKLRLS